MIQSSVFFTERLSRIRTRQVGLFKASSEKAAGDGPEEGEGEDRGDDRGRGTRREARETQAQTHTGRVIYCNEDLWRQI